MANTGSRRFELSESAIAVAGSPVTVLALAVLIANDHFLKQRWPGAATGIASDLAGLVLLPIVIAAFADLAVTRTVSWEILLGIATVVALGYAAIELVPICDRAYEHVAGVAQFPVDLVTHRRPFLPVQATPDLADLYALPFVLVGPLLWRRTAIDSGSRRSVPHSLGATA